MNWIFQNGDKDNSVVKSAKDYVCNQDEMKKRYVGYLLWGPVGTGKSYIAGDKVQEIKILLNVQDYFSRCFHSNGQREKGGGSTAMKKQKLNYRFHNPNTAEVTANYILKVFIEVNAKKVDRVMQEMAERGLEEDKQERK